MTSYDIWKTSAPEPLSGRQPMICSLCGERNFLDIEDYENVVHCSNWGFDGLWRFDDSYTWDPSDDPSFPY